MELDRILEEERRQQAMQVFKQATDNNYEKYIENLQDNTNLKNASSGIHGVFGMGDTGANHSFFPDLAWLL